MSYYSGATFGWTGTDLTGAVKSGTTYSFTYNDEGIRTAKTKSGVTTAYYLSGSQIVAEETSGNLTVYIYDAEGLPLGMRYHGAAYAEDVWDVYWYEKNIFGDVVAVYNSAGTKLISYKYDAFGKATRSYHNSGGSTTATKNPFRYRGYYYDQDLQLYYLNSRYYDGYTGRFISPDSLGCLGANGDLNSYNLYAYCSNNPVNFVDPTGNFAISATLAMILIGTAIGAVTGFGMDAGKQLIANGWDFEDVDWGSAVNSGIVGAALGFSLSMGVGYLGPVIAGVSTASGLTAGGAFAISTLASFSAGALGYASEEWINGRSPTFGKAMLHGGFVALEGMVNFAAGGMVGSIGNIGTKGAFLKSKEWWGKFVFGLEFTQPFKIGVDYMRHNVS